MIAFYVTLSFRLEKRIKNDTVSDRKKIYEFRIMPNESITGRERFLAKLEPYLAEDELEKVLAAYMFSKYGHFRQTRDCGKKRYFEHPRAVANIIIDELKINNDWRIVVAALLHDILEDSWIVSEKRIAVNFGKRVARWIVYLTETPGVDYHERFRACTEWEILLIKLSDRLHNVRTLSVCSVEKQKKYIAKTKEQYLPLADKLISLLPQNYAWRGAYLKSEIQKHLEGPL